MSPTLYAGTVGASVWQSDDLGETWDRPFFSGLYFECRVFSLTAQPAHGAAVVAGTDQGIWRWLPDARRWEKLADAPGGRIIWSIAQSPHDPMVLLAGSTPAALFRSEDGGVGWSDAGVKIPEECEAVDRTRVTQILFDPIDPALVWATVEIAGVFRSHDSGRTWVKRVEGLTSEDMHGIAVVRRNGRRRLLAATNKGLHISDDDGDHWTFRDVEPAMRTMLTPGEAWQYTRAVTAKPDGSGAIFLTNGDGPPGSTGRLLRSEDQGETWSAVSLPVDLNSTLWCVAVSRADPQLVFCCTAYGQLFRSRDGGATWSKLRRELGEIRALLAVD